MLLPGTTYYEPASFIALSLLSALLNRPLPMSNLSSALYIVHALMHIKWLFICQYTASCSKAFKRHPPCSVFYKQYHQPITTASEPTSSQKIRIVMKWNYRYWKHATEVTQTYTSSCSNQIHLISKWICKNLSSLTTRSAIMRNNCNSSLHKDNRV